MSGKRCEACEQVKPLDEFRRVTTHFGGDGYAKKCKACKASTRAEKAPEAAPEPEYIPEGPHLKLGPSFGFMVEISDGDFVLTQTTENGTVQIWLSPPEMQRLGQFVREQNQAASIPQ